MTRGILFLCSDGACRSPMAEGLALAMLAPGLRVLSAGVVSGDVDVRAVQALSELGVEISAHRPRPFDVAMASEVDRIITLGGPEAPSRAAWPAVPGLEHEHWPLDAGPIDEAAAGLEQVRLLRDELVRRMMRLVPRFAPEPALGVIGGSGFYALPGLSEARRLEVNTPFGPPSAPLVEGRLSGRRVVFLARHGEGHRLLPSEINTRANLYALKRAGVTRLVSVSAVGSLREQIAPGDVVLPHQFIDRTMGRPSTFFGRGVVAHVSLADPVCGGLSSALAAAAEQVGARVHARATYVCIEGPQFSTRAESALWRSYGADVVGMTNLPEARLAREAELCYATLALPTDYDSWRPQDEVRLVDVLATLMANVERAKNILAHAFAELDAGSCACQRVLDTALLTQPKAIDAACRLRLSAVLARRLSQLEEAG